VDLLYAGNSISSVCDAMDISLTTYWNTKQRNATFAAQCAKAMSYRAHLVEDALFYSALGGAVQAQKFFLVNRAGDRWKSEHHVSATHEITGKDGAPIETRTTIDLATLTDEELDKLAGIAERAHGDQAGA